MMQPHPLPLRLADTGSEDLGFGLGSRLSTHPSSIAPTDAVHLSLSPLPPSVV